MFRPIHNLLNRVKLAKAAKARNVAFLAHKRAVATGDTQLQHHTRAALVRATHEKLRLEVRG